MATINPTPNIFKTSCKGRRFNCLLKYNNNPNVTTVINNLYQTSRPSFNPISLPNIAVKPAKKTAICSWIKAFRMGSKDREDAGRWKVHSLRSFLGCYFFPFQTSPINLLLLPSTLYLNPSPNKKNHK